MDSDVPGSPTRRDPLPGYQQPALQAAPPYQQSGPQYVYQVAPPKNDLGTWSLVTGILSWIVCPLILGIVAVVTGHAAKKAIRAGLANNSGAATAGLILGWINVGLVVAVIVVSILIWVVMVIGIGAASIGTGAASYSI